MEIKKIYYYESHFTYFYRKNIKKGREFTVSIE